MNALFVLRPAKLWAFNIGHPCPSLAKGELNVIVLRPNFQQTSNRSRTIIKPRPFRYPTKIRNVINGRNLQRLTAARSGTVSGDPPQNLHSTIVKPRPFHYPAKIRNIIKGRNLLRPTGAYSWSAKL